MLREYKKQITLHLCASQKRTTKTTTNKSKLAATGEDAKGKSPNGFFYLISNLFGQRSINNVIFTTRTSR